MLNISRITIDSLSHDCITDNKNPVISFTLESDEMNVELTKAIVKINDWEIETNNQLYIRYDGKELSPFKEYEVEVNAYDNKGNYAFAKTSFRTGRLDLGWKGQWITDGSYQLNDKDSPIPMVFKKEFCVDKKVESATLLSTALGIYELELNHTKIGEDYFAPGFTSYDHQIQYQTYDLTSSLKEKNTLIVTVGGGWAVGSFTYKRKNKVSADRQAFLCEIHVNYEDGSNEVIMSDTSWLVSEDGPHRFGDWYDGEVYDSTIQLDKINWKSASITQPRKKPRIMAQYGLPVRVQEVKLPISSFLAKSGEMIYDFGQNFSGVIRAHIKGQNNQKITFRHAEVLYQDELFVESLRTAKATAKYICHDGDQSYSPKLTSMGFRYVGVSGINSENIELEALVLHSDFEEIGSFKCSNEMINQLQSNIRWGGKSNFLDIPTDCPQRDEREGWTGDLSVFASTACFNFDLSRFLDKWLLDMKSEQSKGGGIPMVIPRGGDSWPIMATSCWGDSCILVPWAEYLARGDIGLLRRQYPVMKKFMKAVEFWASLFSVRRDQKHIWKYPFHFGDWCAPDETIKEWLSKDKWVATAYWSNSCYLMSEIARILDQKEDVKYFSQLRETVNKAYINVFTDSKGNLQREFQTAYVLPLHFNMINDDQRKVMAKNLVKLIDKNNGHLATGFTGTPYILFALSDNGYLDEAYKLLLKDTCPSWLYEVKAGGTTIWERWDALKEDGSINTKSLQAKDSDKKEKNDGGMVSFNHYANGAVGDWLYKRVVGIEPLSGGYKTFKIAPKIGGGLTFAEGSIKTRFGKISSRWDLVDQNTLNLMVEVPVNTTSYVELPNGDKHTLGSGKYHFTCKLD